MIKTLFWVTIFFAGATLISIQPACQHWSEKNINSPKIAGK